MDNSNIKQMQSRQVAEDESHQVSRQRNQAQDHVPKHMRSKS